MTLEVPPLYWGCFPPDTEITQGGLCSAPLVHYFLLVSTYEGLPALYCKSLQGRRRPWDPVLFVFFSPKRHSALHVVGTQ